MSHLPFTILAYFLNGIAVTVDKFLLVKHIPNPLIYIFYYSLVSCVILLATPFTKFPSFEVLFLASISTLLWTTGAYLMFRALQIGVLSRVIPIIGTLIPLFLLIDSSINGTINLNETWAVLFFIFGLISLTIFDWKGKISLSEVVLEVGSALFFAISYIILRQAYLQENFLTVFVWSRPILIPVGIIILLVPKLRRIVLAKEGPRLKFFSKAGALFAIGQVSGGTSELLLTFSISLATPALVNSLQGTQYIFLFILSLFLAKKFPEIYKENLSRVVIIFKILGIFCIGAGLYILAYSSFSQKPKLGITYSPRYALELGLDPRENFNKALDELNIKRLRLPVYWDEVEKVEGEYDFSEADYYLNEAQKRGVEVILVLGYKQPRWPECFPPSWTKGLREDQLQSNILKLIDSEVNHFKNYSNIKVWQIENEPFLDFGDCSDNPLSKQFVSKEVELVRDLDSRPILITDSGELTNWVDSMKADDIHGISLYRSVWNPLLYNTITYPFPPIYYKVKADIVKKIVGRPNQESIVAELQTEPWVPAQETISSWDVLEQSRVYPSKNLEKNVEFAKNTGFKSSYLWGVEWWYFMKEKGHPEYVEEAKKLFEQ
ncbi:MAG: hypothetical protein US28_C0005G0027 [Candidatus Daviesbacteria bacterium GW2011_GWA1_36_8]|uniref:GH10 domain-containing protein n=1 Tax=Candidatus Daviesbacteria bacterium GW2011_GWA1_36_8 TaxID=1618417 RepID=A0A0G0FDY2_9BACT|nr:MAG: hypothetical protein US28_C0005G0027 [Candidatus Daviesbacteria bacterium GW2011_GWA1_36_8]